MHRRTRVVIHHTRTTVMHRITLSTQFVRPLNCNTRHVYCAQFRSGNCQHYYVSRCDYVRGNSVAHVAYDAWSLDRSILAVGNEFGADDRDNNMTRSNHTVQSRMQIAENFTHRRTQNACKRLLAIRSYCAQNLRLRNRFGLRLSLRSAITRGLRARTCELQTWLAARCMSRSRICDQI